MLKLDLLTYQSKLRIKDVDDKRYIFDPVRRKDIILQPEELVRQLFIAHLIFTLDISPKLIQVEKQFRYGKSIKRYDIVVFDQKQMPRLLVECKSFDVKIDSKVFDQVSLYNFSLRIPYLVVTNGHETHCAAVDLEKKTFQFMDHLPTI